jgi:BlaI family transcriptional regulator, penicillinase repressor
LPPPNKRNLQLGAAELEVLKALWEGGPATVREVLEHLHDRGRQVAYTTVQTVLTRLEQKGAVRSDRSGSAFRYHAAVSRERFSRSRLSRLLAQLYDGAAFPLILQLVKTQPLSAYEIEQLQRLMIELDTKDNPRR